MALHLPKPRTKKPAQEPVGRDGLKVSVANAATSGVEKSKQVKSGGLAGLTSKVSVKQLRKELGNEGLRQAAIDAGRTPVGSHVAPVGATRPDPPPGRRRASATPRRDRTPRGHRCRRRQDRPV